MMVMIGSTIKVLQIIRRQTKASVGTSKRYMFESCKQIEEIDFCNSIVNKK